jgi:aminotransferase EvaB
MAPQESPSGRVTSLGSDLNIKFNDLSTGWIASSPDVRVACARVVERGWYVRGPEVAGFERELAAYVGCRGVVGVASGTDALAISMRALWRPNRPVAVVPANGGGYASIAAAMAGYGVVYADVDPVSLLVDAKSVKRVLADDVGVVVVTHLYGNPVDVLSIQQLCESRGVFLLEDCAQAIGAVAGGGRLGSLGDLAAFSFYPTKNLGAIGDAGAISVRDEWALDRVRRLAQYGWGAKYEIGLPGGVNSRLDEIQAAVLRLGLPKLDGWNTTRRGIVATYADALDGARFRLVTADHGTAVAHLAVVLCGSSQQRDALRDHLEELGIETEVHYPIVDADQAGLPRPARESNVDCARSASTRILSLPCHPFLRQDEVQRVAAALRSA